jgi:hypothetical protein
LEWFILAPLRIMRHFCTTLLLLISLFGCKSKKVKADQMPAEIITFGSGGGFTGQIQEYVLQENGQLFYRAQIEGELKELESVKRKMVKACFEKARLIPWKELGAGEPGNVYHYIMYKTSTESQKHTWGKLKSGPSSPIDSLYRMLGACLPAEKK